MNKALLFAAGVAVAAAFGSCGGSKSAETVADGPMRVIFETDMGNDVDDALALDMLFKYMEQGKIDLIGISSNKRNEGSIEYIDAMTTWYGYPEIPLGKVVNGADCDDANNYAYHAMQVTDSLGNPAFKQSHDTDGFIMPSVEMYRKVLSQQPDTSVTVISVGFSTNLAQLLASQPDKYSDLNGKELVAKKVKTLVTMAGGIDNPDRAEYNIVRDIPAAQAVFAEWPTTVVTSPWELGNYICYPATSIENDFKWADYHPVVEGYKAYLPMPYDRPTWDLTSVLYAVEGADNYFTISGPGDITVNDKGNTLWKENAQGTRYYMSSDSIQQKNILNHFIELITSKPKNR